MAYWDVTGDNLPDLNPTAIFVGGVSGTHRGVQLYFQNDGVTPLAVPYEAVLTMYAGGEFLAMAFAANGANLALVGNWIGPSAADVAANTSATVGHTLNFDFAKLTLAAARGWKWSAARVITLKAQVLKSGELSQNGGNVLQMPLEVSQGTLFGAEQLLADGGLFYLPQRVTSTVNNQGLITIKDDLTKWSKNNFKNVAAIPDTGLSGDIFNWSPSPTGKAMILTGINDNQGSGGGIFKETWIVPIETFDADGLPTFDNSTRIYVNGVGLTGAGLGQGGNVPLTHPTLELNGTPVLIVCKPETGGTGYIMVNTGTLAAPSYDTNLQTYTLDTRLRSPQGMKVDSQGRVYITTFAPNSPAPLGHGVFRLTYSGANNDQAALVNASNWAVEEIGFAGSYVAPTASGNGLTASYRGNGLAIDEDNLVNGEPTIYMSDRRGQVIFKITANTLNPSGGADWDFNIVVGQADTAGAAEGIGLAAQFNSPIGLQIKDGTLYVAEKFGSKIRTIDLTTLQTATWFGIDTIRSHTDQFSF